MKKPSKFITMRTAKNSLIEFLTGKGDESPFPEDEDYDSEHPRSLPQCRVIRYHGVSYACVMPTKKGCRGYCPSCSYGVRI